MNEEKHNVNNILKHFDYADINTMDIYEEFITDEYLLLNYNIKKYYDITSEIVPLSKLYDEKLPLQLGGSCNFY